MDKKDVIEFFDRCAPTWDAGMVKSDEIIGKILDNAEIGEGMNVLDVACGTGVMFPYYLERGAASVTGIDISSAMAGIAAAKYEHEPRVKVICGDVEETEFDGKFDRIVVYNAFPHFPDPGNLIRVLASLLDDGGRLTIAHGMSREAIDSHHNGPAGNVSNGLMPVDELKKLLDPYFDVEAMVSNSRMYQISGVKCAPSMHAHTKVTHSHGGLVHAHDHGDEKHTHAPEGNGAPVDAITELMKYLVSHNAEHANEVKGLASKILDAGRYEAYEEIMEAVDDFNAANDRMTEVIDRLEKGTL